MGKWWASQVKGDHVFPGIIDEHMVCLAFTATLSQAMSLNGHPDKGENQKMCAFQNRFYFVWFLLPFHIKEEGILNLVGFQLFPGSSQSRRSAGLCWALR